MDDCASCKFGYLHMNRAKTSEPCNRCEPTKYGYPTEYVIYSRTRRLTREKSKGRPVVEIHTDTNERFEVFIPKMDLTCGKPHGSIMAERDDAQRIRALKERGFIKNGDGKWEKYVSYQEAGELWV